MGTSEALLSAPAQKPATALFGISAALVTPFTEGGAIDLPRAAGHAARVIGAGADGVTLFGTTGEGASLGMMDRAALLGAVLGAGVAPARLTVCVAATALDEAVAQAEAALTHGVGRFLLAPPFYFKGVSDDALFDWVTEFLRRLAGASPRVLLYHIPQVTGVPISAALLRRLRDAHGEAILGVKDSAGDWETSERFLRHPDLAVLIGDERLLPRAAPLGGAGAISGMANLFPARLGRTIRTGAEDPEMRALVDRVVAAPVTPLVKALVGALYDEAGWERVRPPLSPADPALVGALASQVVALAE